eukprot:TRINITY_DN21041_c2_g1_i1.p1 TRINITY_DN21041_c2_g1~~TRINITY_DN21041_c2_g1_i1.p1  ORF type:complete len:434 (+),score=45.87 TRINITY_DN21041_c2_g1_i1:99-1400(+)
MAAVPDPGTAPQAPAAVPAAVEWECCYNRLLCGIFVDGDAKDCEEQTRCDTCGVWYCTEGCRCTHWDQGHSRQCQYIQQANKWIDWSYGYEDLHGPSEEFSRTRRTLRGTLEVLNVRPGRVRRPEGGGEAEGNGSGCPAAEGGTLMTGRGRSAAAGERSRGSDSATAAESSAAACRRREPQGGRVVAPAGPRPEVRRRSDSSSCSSRSSRSCSSSCSSSRVPAPVTRERVLPSAGRLRKRARSREAPSRGCEGGGQTTRRRCTPSLLADAPPIPAACGPSSEAPEAADASLAAHAEAPAGQPEPSSGAVAAAVAELERAAAEVKAEEATKNAEAGQLLERLLEEGLAQLAAEDAAEEQKLRTEAASGAPDPNPAPPESPPKPPASLPSPSPAKRRGHPSPAPVRHAASSALRPSSRTPTRVPCAGSAPGPPAA